MKFVSFLLVGWLLCPTFTTAAFISDTDVPLMEGTVVVEDESFSFDTPAGQIMTWVVHANEPVQTVLAFYHAALQELGWTQDSASQYTRDNDSLTLTVIPRQQGSEVKIQMTFPNK